jgi:uncharacterized protein YdaT
MVAGREKALQIAKKAFIINGFCEKLRFPIEASRAGFFSQN